TQIAFIMANTLFHFFIKQTQDIHLSLKIEYLEIWTNEAALLEFDKDVICAVLGVLNLHATKNIKNYINLGL
ncbi:hypothetical protein ACJX0J_022097, partial [Zea mays]